jgi:FKBP-type peptidyl-prolyl cis-trans isomerase SlyD
MQIGSNKVVSLAYTLRNGQGETMDEADASDPLVYLHGHGSLLPKFEAELDGLKAGDAHAFRLAAADGYGERLDSNVQEIERAHLPPNVEPEVGMAILADFGFGQRPFPIIKVTPSHITIDMNHPLAGEELHFSVEVVEVREASPEEVAHGHVHGPGGHHH